MLFATLYTHSRSSSSFPSDIPTNIAGLPRPGVAFLPYALLDGQHESCGLGHCPGRKGGREGGREGRRGKREGTKERLI